MSTRQTETHGPLRGMASAMARPSGISIARMIPVKRQLPEQGEVEALGVQHLLEPPDARPEEYVVAEGSPERRS